MSQIEKFCMQLEVIMHEYGVKELCYTNDDDGVYAYMDDGSRYNLGYIKAANIGDGPL